jgi:glycosyltransferase involved in cell wall biosynthesis
MILLISYDVSRRGGIERLTLQVKAALEGSGETLQLLCPRSLGVGTTGRWLGRARFLLALAFALPQATTVLSMHALLLPALRWMGPFTVLGNLRRRRSSWARQFCWLHGIEVWGVALETVSTDLKRCDGLIASSRFTRDRVLEHPGPWPPTAVVHPGADLIAVERPPEPLPQAPRLLTVARLVRQERYKGHRLVLGALEILRTRGLLPTGLLWLVVGDGDDRQALEQETLQWGLGPWVRFLGSVDDQELERQLRHCSLLILPSAYNPGQGGRAEGEGFGIVYLEAALAGRASIGCRLGGQSDLIVDGETGWLVDPAPEALAACLAQCLADRHTLELAGERARQRALAAFGPERFAAQLQTALQLNDHGKG